MTAGSTSQKKGRPSIRTGDIRHEAAGIDGQDHAEPFADIHYPSRRNAETKQSAGEDPWWNNRSP